MGALHPLSRECPDFFANLIWAERRSILAQAVMVPQQLDEYRGRRGGGRRPTAVGHRVCSRAHCHKVKSTFRVFQVISV
jgi:hypothetical protein